jgi:serine/threonine protein kinase
MKDDKTSISVGADGSLAINEQVLSIPNVFVREEIGRGASGVVLLGRNQVLDRDVAVKLYLRPRSGDGRDKYQQGIAEVRKASEAAFPFTVQIYDAGVVNGCIYVAMEFFDGRPLRDWLSIFFPELAWRYALALKVDALSTKLLNHGLIHGDLHAGNILVHRGFMAPPRYARRNRAHNVLIRMLNEDIELRIIDFGTSLFSGRDFSIARHFTVYEKLIDTLLWPLKMQQLWIHTKPIDPNQIDQMRSWFENYLTWIPFMMLHVLECKTIKPLFMEHIDKPILTMAGHEYILRLVKNRKLKPDEVESIVPWMTLAEYIQHKIVHH